MFADLGMRLQSRPQPVFHAGRRHRGGIHHPQRQRRILAQGFGTGAAIRPEREQAAIGATPQRHHDAGFDFGHLIRWLRQQALRHATVVAHRLPGRGERQQQDEQQGGQAAHTMDR